MASLIAYTKKLLVQRIRQHLANEIPDDEFSITEREMFLYIDQALAFTVVGQVYAGAKVLGTLEVPEGWLTTYELDALVQNEITKEWETTLPQPPVSLPLGYSITRVYFGNVTNGISQDVLPIKAKRAPYRNLMPRPAGAEYKINGSTIKLSANDGQPLSDQTVYVEMIKTRTDEMTEVLNLPDDAIEAVFNSVLQKCLQRFQNPKDIILDDIGPGNTTQKS